MKKLAIQKLFVGFATAGRQRKLRIFYSKHNFFHQCKLGRHVELQNTQIVLFTSPRDVMQVSSSVQNWVLDQN